MNARQYFENVLEAERQIRLLCDQREHWAEMAAKMGGFAEIRVQTSPGNPTEDAAIMLADLVARIDRDLLGYMQTVKEAQEVIKKIQPFRFRQILTLRYLCAMSWAEVQDKAGYKGEKSVHKVHGWALQAAEKFLPRIPNDTI